MGGGRESRDRGREGRVRKVPAIYDPDKESSRPQFRKAAGSSEVAPALVSIAPGSRRPPFAGGLAKHALIALNHDDEEHELRYYVGLVLKGVSKWSSDATVDIVWCDSHKKVKDGWEYKVTSQRAKVEAEMVLCQICEVSGAGSPQASGTPKKLFLSQAEHDYIDAVDRDNKQSIQELSALDTVDSLLRQYSEGANTAAPSPPERQVGQAAVGKRHKPAALDIQPLSNKAAM